MMGRAIGPVGTTLRAVVGLGLLYLGVADERAGLEWGINWWQAVLGLVGLPAALLTVQLIRTRFTRAPLRETSHTAFCVNFAAGAALIIASPTQPAALVFLGASLLLAAWRGYGGCESLAISNWVLRRDDQVGCVLFSPIDEVETRLRA